MTPTAAQIEAKARDTARQFLLESLLSALEAIEDLDALIVGNPSALRRLSAQRLYRFADDVGHADAKLRALAARLKRLLKAPDDDDDDESEPTPVPQPAPKEPPARKPAPRLTKWPLLVPDDGGDDED